MANALLITALVAVLIFFNALYVAAEFATVASRRTRVTQLAGQGDRMAQRLLPLLEDGHKLDNYVAACQIGITISSLVAGAFGQNVIAQNLSGPLAGLFVRLQALGANFGSAAPDVAAAAAAAIIVLATLTTLQVVLGELVPKSVAIQYPERVATLVVIPMEWSLLIFRPIIRVFNGSGRLLLRLLGHGEQDTHHRSYSPEEIEILVSGSHEGGLLDAGERQMLRNAFRLRDLTARQVMIHRTRIAAAPVDSAIKDLINLSLAEGFTRIPIYEETIDRVRGFVHIKDVFRLYVQQSEDLAAILRPVVQVPEAMPVVDVWEILNKQRQYVAIVFDEYGGTAGLITMEDLVEEVFGELQDEFDDETALISLDKEGRIYLRGDLLVNDVNEYLDLDLPGEVADTLGGLVISDLGRKPRVGDQVQIGGRIIRVEAMEDLSIAEVSLDIPSTTDLETSDWEMQDRE